MNPRQFSIIAGVSYLIIFFTAIYANFFVLESIINDPLGTITQDDIHVRLGALGFLVAAVFDVLVAWALYELYKGHPFTRVSTYFRIMHAVIMGVAVYALYLTLHMTTSETIMLQVTTFNTMWLIGLFFFGVHLMLLGKIVTNIRFIPYVLMFAGFMYVVDTSARFLLQNYEAYADTFLMFVAVPAIIGEMGFALWLLYKGGKESV